MFHLILLFVVVVDLVSSQTWSDLGELLMTLGTKPLVTRPPFLAAALSKSSSMDAMVAFLASDAPKDNFDNTTVPGPGAASLALPLGVLVIIFDTKM
jgi:hypothetical protein